MSPLIGFALPVLLELLAVPITVMMKVPQAAFESTVSYLRICAAGAVFIVAYNVIGSVFRGVGDSRMPLLTVSIACAGNIAGDLLLVGVFNMAAAGAAAATVLAQAFSVILSALVIRHRNLPFPFKRKYVRLERNIAARIIKLGIPIALQDVLVSVSFLAITAIVNTLGVIASAGVGVAEKICGFILLVPSAFMQSISAFVAQNIGARKPERAKKALLYSILVSLGIAIFLAWFAFFHGDVLAGIFNKDSRVIAAAADYLKAYAVDCLLVSFMFCYTGYFNGCGKTSFVMLQGIAGAFGVRIPVSYFMSQIVPVSLFRIGLATPASTLLQIVLCAGYYIWIEKRAAAGAR